MAKELIRKMPFIQSLKPKYIKAEKAIVKLYSSLYLLHIEN